MKSNLILLFTVIILLGIISESRQKKSHINHSKKHESKTEPADKKEEKTDKKAGSSSRKSLQNLNTIIEQIQQKQPLTSAQKNQDGEIKDIQLFLDQKINPESSTNPADLNNNKLCSLKQGYMTQIIKSEKVKDKKIASGRHVFTVLNKKTVSIFEALHVNSLLASLDLQDINEPEVTISKLNCFKLENKNKKERGFELCANNVEEMKQWMYDIKNMLTCNPYAKPVIVDPKAEIETSEEDSSDLKMKITQKRHKLENKVNQQQDEQAIAQARSAEFARKQAIKDEQQKKIIEIQMQKAMDAMRKKRAYEEKRKRIEETRRQKITKKNKKTQEDIKCMEKKLESEEMKQRKEVEISIKESISKEIQEDLAKTVSGITEAETKGTDQVLEDEQELTEEKQQDQNKYQDILVQEVMDYEKDVNPQQCYAESNQKGAAVKQMCPTFIQPGQAIDLEELKECLDFSKFCNHCCSYNLGREKQVEMKQCKDRCERVVNPEKYLRNKAKTGELTKPEEAELFELDGSGFLVTVNKGNRIPGWNKELKKKSN